MASSRLEGTMFGSEHILKPLVSIIVPAFNEEKTVLELLTRVKSQHHQEVAYETIVVDDGSSDSTTQILRSHPNLYDKIHFREKNGGKGAAVIDGLNLASGDFILFQDADLEYNPAEYEKLLRPILVWSADLVIGTRLSGGSVTRVHYFWHRVGNKFITLLFNVLHNTTFTDVYSCYVVFRRSMLDVSSLRTANWSQQAEILSLLMKRKPVAFETPINYFGRQYSEGKKIHARHIFGVIRRMIVTRFRSIKVP